MKEATFLFATISILIEMISKKENWERTSTLFLIVYLLYSAYYNSKWNKGKYPLKKGQRKIMCKTGMRAIFIIAIIFISAIISFQYLPQSAFIIVLIYETLNKNEKF